MLCCFVKNGTVFCVVFSFSARIVPAERLPLLLLRREFGIINTDDRLPAREGQEHKMMQKEPTDYVEKVYIN